VPIRRIRADPYSLPASGAQPAYAGDSRHKTSSVPIRVLFPLPGHSPLRVTQTPTAPLSPIAYDKPSARQDEARRRGLTHAVGLKPSARQDEARRRGLTHAVGLKPSAIQDEARLCGLCRQDFIRADPYYPCRSVFSSRLRSAARLRRTQTPTATLSAISYRLSAGEGCSPARARIR
jgi:hypothetical protein